MRRFFLLLSALAIGCGTGAGPADLVLLGGKIVTLDEDRPEASALAARDGRIVALGEDDEIRVHVGPETRVIDLEGRLAVPGFIEGHGHFTGLGRSLMTLDLTGARTWEDVVELTAAAASRAEPGEWILGGEAQVLGRVGLAAGVQHLQGLFQVAGGAQGLGEVATANGVVGRQHRRLFE